MDITSKTTTINTTDRATGAANMTDRATVNGTRTGGCPQGGSHDWREIRPGTWRCSKCGGQKRTG